jgi:hypothetical protein
MTKEEMLKLLAEMPDGANIEDYIRNFNNKIDINVLREEYDDIMDLMRAAHKRYINDSKKNIITNDEEYWKEIIIQEKNIKKKYNLSDNIAVLDWMHDKIFNS